MIKSLLCFSSLALVSGSSAIAQTSVATTPVGFSTMTAPVGTSVIVPSLMNPQTYVGEATFGSTSVTPTVNPNWTAGAFNETSFANPTPNYPTYYVEIIDSTAGAYLGSGFDIVSNTSSSVTVPAGDIPPALVGQTFQVEIRQHVTLNMLSTGATGLSANSDFVHIYNSDGSISARYWTGTSWVAEDHASAAGQTILYPGQGLTLTTQNGASLLLQGSVKATQTAIPLYVGVTNIVGPISPAASSTFVTANIASALGVYTGVLNIYSTNGALTNIGTYYSNGTNILNSSYMPLPANATDGVSANGGFVISVTGNSVWLSNAPYSP